VIDYTKPLADPEAEERVQGALKIMRLDEATAAFEQAMVDLHHANDVSRTARHRVRDALDTLTAAREAVDAHYSLDADDVSP
jgi:hypothetical protein